MGNGNSVAIVGRDLLSQMGPDDRVDFLADQCETLDRALALFQAARDETDAAATLRFGNRIDELVAEVAAAIGGTWFTVSWPADALDRRFDSSARYERCASEAEALSKVDQPSGV